MIKYSELSDYEINLAVAKLKRERQEYFVPVWEWDDCSPVMDDLLAITTGINLKFNGTATTEINGKQESAGGGHCRAICELYLMAHDAEVKSDN